MKSRDTLEGIWREIWAQAPIGVEGNEDQYKAMYLAGASSALAQLLRGAGTRDLYNEISDMMLEISQKHAQTREQARGGRLH